MDFVKLPSVISKSSLLHQNIHIGEDHIDCSSRLEMIDDRQSTFKFLIPVSDNLLLTNILQDLILM